MEERPVVCGMDDPGSTVEGDTGVLGGGEEEKVEEQLKQVIEGLREAIITIEDFSPELQDSLNTSLYVLFSVNHFPWIS